MRRLAITGLMASLFVAGCSAQPTRAEIETACAEAIAARAEGDTAKPEVCEPLPEKDYDTLVLGHIIKEMGVVGEDGEVDLSKLVEKPTP